VASARLDGGDGLTRRNRDQGLGARGVQQGLVEVGPVDGPVGRAMTTVDRLAEGKARQFPPVDAVVDDDVLRDGNVLRKPRLEAEADQNTGCVRAELDAGAFVDRAAARLVDLGWNTAAREREGGRQAGDPAAGDEDRAAVAQCPASSPAFTIAPAGSDSVAARRLSYR
jgi:hypothetical protein